MEGKLSKVGRPKEDLTSLPKDWYKKVLELYSEGASDVEIKDLISTWRGSCSNNLWCRWMKEHKVFREVISKGRDSRLSIRVNDSEKHKKRLKKRSKNRTYDYVGTNKIDKSFRSLFYYHIKNTSAKFVGSKFKMLGYTKEELVSHVKENLKEGMTIDNYGEWHLDHIKPASWFNHNDVNEIKKCWALSNLDPKWAFDNISKGNRFEG